MIGQSFRMAFSSIAANKMRSFLTMLGIIIGIMAVVILVSIVSSSTTSITDELSTLGADKLSVNIMTSSGQPYTLAEVQELTELGAIENAAATTSQSATAKSGDTSVTASVVGTTPSYADVNSLAVQSGRFIKTPDVDNNTAVAVLGSEIAEDIFGTASNIVGETFSLDGRSFLVIGVLEDAGQSLAGSENTNIIIPYTVAQRMFYVSGVSSFTVTATEEMTEQAETQLENTLLARFKDEDSFNIMNQSSLAESMDSITNTMALMMGGIAGISLLVGGIGIMNIMLVSVAERTKEIGIRKAIGAGKKRILTQFLIEALVLSVFGGLIGIGVSWVVLTVLSAALDTTYAMSGGVAALAVIFSLVIGVVFGLSPANKAAKMPPIEALRTE